MSPNQSTDDGLLIKPMMFIKCLLTGIILEKWGVRKGDKYGRAFMAKRISFLKVWWYGRVFDAFNGSD